MNQFMSERTTARVWYSDSTAFEEVCRDALRQAKGESDEQFAADMWDRVRQHGLNTYMSEKQMKNLHRIADHVLPPKRVSTNEGRQFLNRDK